MQLNGSEIVVECLKEQGVDTVFGYPGGSFRHSTTISAPVKICIGFFSLLFGFICQSSSTAPLSALVTSRRYRFR